MTTTIARLTRAVVALLVLAAWLSAEAQQPRVARIGVITSGSPTTAAAWVDAFRQRLRELGYAEGRNVAIDVRYESAQPERLRTFAAELVGLGVDVIVASGTAATRAAKAVTSTIPIVMVSVGDAVGAGLVRSLARPSANITGQSFMGPEMALKQFDLLMETRPRAKRVAAIYNPDISSLAGFGALDAAAHVGPVDDAARRGVRLVRHDAGGVDGPEVGIALHRPRRRVDRRHGLPRRHHRQLAVERPAVPVLEQRHPAVEAPGLPRPQAGSATTKARTSLHRNVAPRAATRCCARTCPPRRGRRR